ncbi:ExbD/TolR family protein [Haliovirga abyssi]|uniref:Biopolymer transport protein ExbD n=1 Tax=Haliovirga abyssi TaxID=2996794 RepID=A0AAU9D8N9_9FUSO|nr:biopolymer transporter ExbD [Haliovirga abyssi]BDU50973.1 biopolymer transport protein ExbD [Haliovirga abyssi]
MKFRPKYRRENKDMFLELTPLIDVVFLLLIFFMVSTTFTDINTGINITLPESAVKELPQEREVIVSITKQKNIYINRKKVSNENFENKLSDKLKELKKYNVIIKADKSLSYGIIVEIMSKAKDAGALELDIATDEKE